MDSFGFNYFGISLPTQLVGDMEGQTSIRALSFKRASYLGLLQILTIF